MEIIISIINYRTSDLTIACAKSALRELTEVNGMVVVVDNASKDGSVEKLTNWIETLTPSEHITLVQSDQNTGFSGGHNQGIAFAHANYYLLLNSDALLRPGFINEILSAAAQYSDVGLFAPRIDYDDGVQQTSCFRFHSPTSELIRGAASGPITRLLDDRQVPLQMPPNPERIDWASFACILIRGQMIREIGNMDPGYFLYFEDVEFCWRARQNGWKIAYVPEAKAVHFRGGSGPVKALEKEKKRLPAYFYASRTRMFRQFYGRTGPLRANLAWLAGRGVAQLRRVVGKHVPRANQREAADIWTNIFDPLGDSRAPKD